MNSRSRQVVYVDKFVTFTFGVITWLTTAACADLLITIGRGYSPIEARVTRLTRSTFAVIYYLRKNRISEYDETNSCVSSSAARPAHRRYRVIDSLLRNLVQTNGITTIVAIINACVFASLPFEGWHAIPTLVLLKFYFNSLLVSRSSSSSPPNLRSLTNSELSVGKHVGDERAEAFHHAPFSGGERPPGKPSPRREQEVLLFEQISEVPHLVGPRSYLAHAPPSRHS